MAEIQKLIFIIISLGIIAGIVLPGRAPEPVPDKNTSEGNQIAEMPVDELKTVVSAPAEGGGLTGGLWAIPGHPGQ